MGSGGGGGGGGGDNSAMINMMLMQMVQSDQQFKLMQDENKAMRDDIAAARAEAKSQQPIQVALLGSASSEASQARAEALQRAADAEGLSRTTRTSPMGIATKAATNKSGLLGSLADPTSPVLTRSVIGKKTGLNLPVGLVATNTVSGSSALAEDTPTGTSAGKSVLGA